MYMIVLYLYLYTSTDCHHSNRRLISAVNFSYIKLAALEYNYKYIQMHLQHEYHLLSALALTPLSPVSVSRSKHKSAITK